MGGVGWVAADLLPGLYVFVLAAGLAALLRRWFDPLPRWALLLFLLLVTVLFGRVLFAGAILLPLDVLRLHVPFRELRDPRPYFSIFLQRDLVHQIAPWALEVKKALLAGRWPLWNAHVGAGMPLMADPQTQPFQPLVAAAYPFSVWVGFGVTAALRVFCALTFTFLLLRRQGLREPAAAAGSLAFGLGSFILLWLNWPIAGCASLLPAVLYALVRCAQGGGRRDFCLLTLSAAALLLGGHPETMTYGFVLTGLFLLDLVRGRRRGERWRLAWRCCLALALAGAFAAPPLLLARAYLPTSSRAAVVRYVLAPRPLGELWRDLERPSTLAFWGRRAVGRLLPVAAPRAFGDAYTAYWGQNNYIEDTGSFAGTLPLLAAVVGAMPCRRAGRRRFPQERLMLGVLLGGLLLLAQPPGFENLAARLPLIGLTAIHRHARVQLLVAFAVAYLAACEIERWSSGELRRRVVPGVAAALAGLVAWAYLGHINAGLTWRQDSIHLWWMWLQGTLLAVGCALLLLPPGAGGGASGGDGEPPAAAAARRGGRAARALRAGLRRAPWVACALVAGELLYDHLPANPSSPKDLAFPVTPPIAFLMRQLGGGPMAGRIFGVARAFPANFPEVYGLCDVRIDNPALPELYDIATQSVSRGFTLEPAFRRPSHPLYDLLGARYVVARAGAELPFSLAFKDPAGWIYERPHPLPRMFLPERTFPLRTSWSDWLESNPDFGFRAMVETGPEVWKRWRAERPGASALAAGEPGDRRLDSEHLRAHALLAETRLLATSVFQDGGWRLLAGGVRRPTSLVNGPFAGAWLPPGEWQVDLIYRPPPLLPGCLLVGLAAAAAIFWWVPAPRRRAVLS